MADMNFENRKQLSYTFLRVITKISEINSRTRNYGTTQELHDAEIHMIKAVKENEGLHVTGLAKLLGVTKGAVSQIIMKLEKKGMIVKETDPKNLSRLIIKLTLQGETADNYHRKLHQKFDKTIYSLLEEASEEQRQFLIGFLDNLDKKLDEYE